MTLITCKCECGYIDDIDKFLTVSPIRKVKKPYNGEEIYDHLIDRTFKCPKCGVTKVLTGSVGYSFVEPDAEEY